jgi:hypothetical protein
MTVRRIDSITGEIVTSGTQFLTGREEVAQTIGTRLKQFLGEYFRDITQGTPWFQSILGKGGTLSTADAAIKTIIIETPDVSQILEYNADYDEDTRTYSITGQILTTFGVTDLTVNGVI